MPKYIDTGLDKTGNYLADWLEIEFSTVPTAIWCQFGYFSWAGFAPYQDSLAKMVEQNAKMAIVLGSNQGSIVKRDVDWCRQLIEGNNQATLSVVAFANAQFHPKTFVIERADGSVNHTVPDYSRSKDAGTKLGKNLPARKARDSRKKSGVKTKTPKRNAKSKSKDSELNSRLRNRNCIDHWVTIQKLSDRTYRIVNSPTRL